MLFIDNIVLVVETKENANTKLEEWKTVLEGRELGISHTKIESLRCNFSGTKKIGERELNIGKEVTHRIQAGSLK